MSTYRVDMNQVEYIVGEMVAIQRRINETVQQLDQQSVNNLQSWDGDVKDFYMTQKGVWDGARGEMERQLASATSGLGSINEFYRLGERQGVNTWDM